MTSVPLPVVAAAAAATAHPRDSEHPGGPARSAAELERGDGDLDACGRQLRQVGQLDEGDPVRRRQLQLHRVPRLPAELDVDAFRAEAGDVPLPDQPLRRVAREP